MTNETPLADRIATALTKSGPSADVQALLDETATAVRKAEAILANASRRALSPLTTSKEAAAAKADRETAQFDLERLQNSSAALTKRLRELKEAEKASERDKREAAAIATRDNLVIEIREKVWPALQALAETFARIRANNAELEALRINEHAESIARGVPRNMYIGSGPVPAFINMKIPELAGTQNIWPPRPGPGFDYSAALIKGREERAKAEQAERESWSIYSVTNGGKGTNMILFTCRTGKRGVMDEPVLVEMTDEQAQTARDAGVKAERLDGAAKAWVFAESPSPSLGIPGLPMDMEVPSGVVKVDGRGLTVQMTAEQIAKARKSGIDIKLARAPRVDGVQYLDAA